MNLSLNKVAAILLAAAAEILIEWSKQRKRRRT
jgi:hypothetical protein